MKMIIFKQTRGVSPRRRVDAASSAQIVTSTIDAQKRKREVQELPLCSNELKYKDGEILNILHGGRRIWGKSSPFYHDPIKEWPLDVLDKIVSSWDQLQSIYRPRRLSVA